MTTGTHHQAWACQHGAGFSRRTALSRVRSCRGANAHLDASERRGLKAPGLRGLPQIVKERQQFQRVEVSRDEAMSMFQENPFKIEILSGLPQEATITLYRCTRT